MTANRLDRFFPTALLGGSLHVRGITDSGPWHTSGIEHAHESFVDAILRPGTGDRVYLSGASASAMAVATHSAILSTPAPAGILAVSGPSSHNEASP